MTNPSLQTQPNDAETLEVTRTKVREILENSEAFQALPPDERREVAQNMVHVGNYMANPEGLLKEASETPLAMAQRSTRGGVRDAADRAGNDQGFAGEDFVGGAIEQGTEQFGELVSKVDFPKFVGGLIENVFQAIVTSSIEQMRAYGEMLKSVSQSVDDFARDNITENNARDWLAETYPDVFEIQTGGGGGDFGFGDESSGGPRLVVTGDEPEVQLGSISTDLQMAKPVTDISEPESEAQLVRAARLSIAKSRMQLLASMVMMGINRIVVTDGSIKAKVVFGMRASDVARRQSRASLYDRQKSAVSSRSAAGIGGLGWGAGSTVGTQNSHVTTVGSSVDENSASQASLKAQLSGDVRVNFKSDYMPMEKLATTEMIAAIQGNAVPQNPQSPQGSGGTASTGAGEPAPQPQTPG